MLAAHRKPLKSKDKFMNVSEHLSAFLIIL